MPRCAAPAVSSREHVNKWCVVNTSLCRTVCMLQARGARRAGTVSHAHSGTVCQRRLRSRRSSRRRFDTWRRTYQRQLVKGSCTSRRLRAVGLPGAQRRSLQRTFSSTCLEGIRCCNWGTLDPLSREGGVARFSSAREIKKKRTGSRMCMTTPLVYQAIVFNPLYESTAHARAVQAESGTLRQVHLLDAVRT